MPLEYRAPRRACIEDLNGAKLPFTRYVGGGKGLEGSEKFGVKHKREHYNKFSKVYRNCAQHLPAFLEDTSNRRQAITKKYGVPSSLLTKTNNRIGFTEHSKEHNGRSHESIQIKKTFAYKV